MPSDQFSYADLAELFTRGYEGYFVPMHFDEPTLRSMVDAWDIDLATVARRARRGARATSAIRGGRAWIGGIAVVPEQRRHGVGRALMEAVLELAPPTVLLEVIDANEPAIKLYESLGFEKTRVLEVWRVEAPEVAARDRRPVDARAADLPWQREDASLPRGLRARRGRRRRDALPRRARCSSSRPATRTRLPRCSRVGRRSTT